jgi:hypothetical protein
VAAAARHRKVALVIPRRKKQKPKPPKKRRVPSHTPATPAPEPAPDLTRMGVFQHPGGFVVDPGCGPLGPVEHCKGMAGRGCKWVAFGEPIGTYPWRIWITEAEKNGLTWMWWMRIAPEQTDRQEALYRLYALCSALRLNVIVNVEDELADGRITIADIEDAVGALTVGISTVAPLYADVDWQHVTRLGWTVLPQAFMNVEPTLTATGALDQAHAAGAGLVNVTCGVYPVQGKRRLTLADYEPLPAAWSVYRVDDVEAW